MTKLGIDMRDFGLSPGRWLRRFIVWAIWFILLLALVVFGVGFYCGARWGYIFGL